VRRARRPGAFEVRQRSGDDAHALRDWCVLSKTGTVFIEPGSPWQNAFVESFHSRVRDELLDVEEFSCLTEARVVIGDWREGLQLAAPALRARDEGARCVRRRVLEDQRAAHSRVTTPTRSGNPPPGGPAAPRRGYRRSGTRATRSAFATTPAGKPHASCLIRAQRYPPRRHIHHPLTRDGPTNGVRSWSSGWPRV
jgi:hypothetical protein